MIYNSAYIPISIITQKICQKTQWIQNEQLNILKLPPLQVVESYQIQVALIKNFERLFIIYHNRRINGSQRQTVQNIAQRKKLVISKENRPLKGINQPKNDQSYDDKENKKNEVKRATLNLRSESLEFQRRPHSRSLLVNHRLISMDKRLSIIPTKTVNSSGMNQINNQPTFQGGLEEKECPIRLVGKNKPIEGFINELLTRLQEKPLLFQNKANSFLIEKNYLAHIFEYLISMLSTRDLLSCNRLFHRYHEVKDILQSICSYCEVSRTKQKYSYLGICSKVTSHDYRHQDYEHTIRQNINMIEYYMEMKAPLSERLRELNEELILKQKLNDDLIHQAKVKRKVIEDQSNKIGNLQQRERQLAVSILQKQVILNNLAEQIKKIEDYGCEHREMIQIVSKDYKEIESDIYEYAVYLQSNRMASELQYEPRPFSEMQHILMLQYKDLRNSLNHSEKISSEGVRQMRQLVERIISFYKKKDLEMRKVAEFKTKCIRQFVQHMKRWLNNWQLKQEFLVNLRNEFVIENKIMHQVLTTIQGSVISKIKEVYMRIEENYKLGNSFY